MHTLIANLPAQLLPILTWVVAVNTSLVLLLQLLNIAVVRYKGRGEARFNVLNALVALASCWFLMQG